MFDIRRFSKSQQAVIKEDTAALSLEYSFKNPTNENDSFFVETCQFLSQMDQELYDQNKAFYGALCESGGNEYLIQESFSEWVDYAKKIVHKVIDFLKALLNKFLVGINMLIKREGYLKNHEKDFSKFKEEHNFHMNCYKFTIEEVNCPKNTVITKFNDMLHEVYDSEVSLGKEEPDGIHSAYDRFMDTIEDKYYDAIRAEVMNKPGIVTAGDYSTELFEVFRDGSSAKDDTEITRTIVDESLLHFKNYSKMKSDLEKQRKQIEKEYNTISKQIDQIVEKTPKGDKKFKGYRYDPQGEDKDNFTEKELGKKVADDYELWTKSIANAVHEISSIHTAAYSARLDALKDRFSQDKAILYKALYRILGNISNGVREDADMSDWLGIEEIGNTDKGQKVLRNAADEHNRAANIITKDYQRATEKKEKHIQDAAKTTELREKKSHIGKAINFMTSNSHRERQIKNHINKATKIANYADNQAKKHGLDKGGNK